MAGQFNKSSSLREEVLKSIKELVHDEGFDDNETLSEGLLEIVNLISDYKEEGQVLFPEVIIIDDLDVFKTISNKEIIVAKKALDKSEFKNVIKLCAPLATGGWVIFVEVKEGKMTYGLIDAELVETSPSIYEQTVGEFGVELEKMSIAYIRNIGLKTVEITGIKKRLNVSLSLENKSITANNEVQRIAEIITKECSQEYVEKIAIFLGKTINRAIKEGHGNLIGVVNTEGNNNLDELKSKLKDGEYLITPIDISDHVIYNEVDKSNSSSVTLKAFSSVLISMLNHDGITLISTKGVVLGYHMFIDSIPKEGVQPIGGARTRAFQSMINSGLFEACFYKSQDGNSKIWIKGNE